MLLGFPLVILVTQLFSFVSKKGHYSTFLNLINTRLNVEYLEVRFSDVLCAYLLSTYFCNGLLNFCHIFAFKDFYFDSASKARFSKVASIFLRLWEARSETPLTSQPIFSCSFVLMSVQDSVTTQPSSTASI